MADKFCIPETETSTSEPNDDEFTVGCKVPDHDGPLKSGWEVNHQWDESLATDRQSPRASWKNGQLRSDNFDELTDFANCLANVLKLIEGAAYRPEGNVLNISNVRDYNNITGVKFLIVQHALKTLKKLK